MRKCIPKSVKAEVLNEFNHRCAICGSDRPHLHHIDENPENSVSDNLIPLCPNCHLSDQHCPTQQISPELLRVFRQFKDPIILGSQFKPLFDRYYNLYCVHHDTSPDISYALDDLVKFVKSLNMGAYYAEMVRNESEYRACYENFGMFVVDGHMDHDKWSQHCLEKQITKINSSKKSVLYYIVEMARYQNWLPKRSNA